MTERKCTLPAASHSQVVMDSILVAKRRLKYLDIWKCVINPQQACAAKVTVVGSVLVCVPKLTSPMFIRAKINKAYQTGDADQMICNRDRVEHPKLYRPLRLHPTVHPIPMYHGKVGRSGNIPNRTTPHACIPLSTPSQCKNYVNLI